MILKPHKVKEKQFAELISDEILIKDEDSALTILVECYYQNFDAILVHEKNIAPAFFDLKNGIAGAVTQKFSNYRMRLFVIGSFEKYASSNQQAFINESTKMGQILFLKSTEDALRMLLSN